MDRPCNSCGYIIDDSGCYNSDYKLSIKKEKTKEPNTENKEEAH